MLAFVPWISWIETVDEAGCGVRINMHRIYQCDFSQFEISFPDSQMRSGGNRERIYGNI